MPDPICSSSSSVLCDPPLIDPPETNACVPDASTRPEPNQCFVGQEPPSGSAVLTAKFDKKDCLAFVENQTAPADATSGQSSTQWLVARASRVPDPALMTNDDAASAAVVTHSGSALDARGLYASVGAGREFDLQAGVIHADGRSELRGFLLSGSADGATARVNLGSENDDGSEGCNVGAMATVVGVEGTVERDGWSATAGVSLSWGVAFSSGEGRDIDRDGKPEQCFKGSLGPLTFGVCTEL